MAGHSRWVQVKHKKAGTDAKRGALFSKLSRQLSIAARDGGSDSNQNPRLRHVIELAREAGMSKDTIERALQRAGGAADLANVKTVEYEAYGPGGSAILIAGLSDNTNRTLQEIKRVVADYGGRLAEAGSVGWLFDRRVLLEFAVASERAEELELALIDGGTEDTVRSDGRTEAIVAPEDAAALTNRVARAGFQPSRSRIVAIPKTWLELGSLDQDRLRALVQALEEHPDVTDVWTNVRLT